MNSATLVQKLWNYCNVLRDDGMSYGDYVEQLTYLLFLRMRVDDRLPGQAIQRIVHQLDQRCREATPRANRK